MMAAVAPQGAATAWSGISNNREQGDDKAPQAAAACGRAGLWLRAPRRRQAPMQRHGSIRQHLVSYDAPGQPDSLKRIAHRDKRSVAPGGSPRQPT